MNKTILFILLFVSVISLRAQELIATAIIQNETCFSNGSGSVNIEATGGEGNYVYALVSSGMMVTASDFLTTNIFASLLAGSYDIYTRDNGGVSNFSETILTVIIEPIEELISTVLVTGPYCSGETGEILVNISGGVSPFQVNVSSVSSASIISTMTTSFNDVVFTDLPAGNYIISVEDSNGCSYDYAVVIDDVAVLESTAVLTQGITCQSEGEIMFSDATGGIPPYEYGVNGIYSSQTIHSNLTDGIYSLSIRDANGCESQLSDISITPMITHDVEVVQTQLITCSGDLGEVRIALSSNTPYSGDYTYEVFNAVTGTSTNISGTGIGNVPITISNLLSGIYSVQISLSESPFCLIRSIDFVIDELNPLFLDISTIAGSCNGSTDGSIIVTTNGGSGNYEYSINGGDTFQTSNVFTGLPGEAYTVLVRDFNGCIAQNTIIVPFLTPIILSSTTVFPTGNTASGNIQIEVSGGNGPAYQYRINGEDNGTSNEFSSLEAGIYEIIVLDANGCESEVFSVTIEQINVDNSIITSTSGVLTANYKNAISYQWINVDTGERIAGATNVDYTPTEVGRYQVEMVIDDATIISGKGIEKVLVNQTLLSQVIDFNSSVLDVEDFSINSFKVYPNPATDLITIPASLINKDFIIYNILGNIIDKGIITTTSLNLEMYSQGVYFLKVKDYDTTRFVKQ